MSTTSGGAKPAKSATRTGGSKGARGRAGGQAASAAAADLICELAGDRGSPLISPLGQGSLVLTPAEGRIAELRMAASDYVQRAIGCELDDSEESLAFVDHYISQVRDGGELHAEVLQLAATALGVYLGEVTRTRFGGRWVALPPAPEPTAAALAPAPGASPGGKRAGATTSAAQSAAAAVVPAGETPILDSIDDPAGWRLQLAAVPLLFDPIGMALQALSPPREKAESDPDSAGESPAAAKDASAADAADREDPVGFATTPELTAPLRAALARLPPVTFDYYYSLTGRFETLSYVVELLAELQQKAAAAQSSPDNEADSDDAPRS